jgi:hypothetical protein
MEAMRRKVAHGCRHGRSARGAALLLAVLVVPALAQAPAPLPDGDAARLVGAPWEFSNADRDRVCDVVFRSERAGPGFKVEFDSACGDLFPIVKDIAAWRFADNDLLRLIDRNGKTLIEFGEVETGVFEAPTPGVGLLFLQAPGADGPPPRTADDVAGDWVMMRGGQPVCTLTLDGNPAGERYPLRLRPGCDPAIAQQGFATWTLVQGELLLAPARGAPWRFEEVDAANFKRVPEGGDPIALQRP